MNLQVDLFAPAPEPAPEPVAVPADTVVYAVVPKGNRFAINWRCGDQFGVIGGLYDDEAAADRGVAFQSVLRDQGIRDPRPWMRVPPEGVRP